MKIGKLFFQYGFFDFFPSEPEINHPLKPPTKRPRSFFNRFLVVIPNKGHRCSIPYFISSL